MPNRKALEELWSERLKGAQLRLESAQTSLHEVLNDNPVSRFSTADGDFAYRRAIREERLALREYARVRRIYQDLTVNGIIPNEDALGKEAGAG